MRQQLVAPKTTTLPKYDSATPFEIAEHLSDKAVKAIVLFSGVSLKFTLAASLADAVANFANTATVRPYCVLTGCNLGIEIPVFESPLKLFVKAHEQTADLVDGLSFGQLR